MTSHTPVPPSLEIRKAPEPPFRERISATTLYLLHKCDRRLWLTRHQPGLAAPASEFDEMIRAKGIEHERRVREGSFAGSVDRCTSASRSTSGGRHAAAPARDARRALPAAAARARPPPHRPARLPLPEDAAWWCTTPSSR